MREIHYTGNIWDPDSMKVYDSSTGCQIQDVLTIEITVTVNKTTEADLIFLDGSSESVEIGSSPHKRSLTNKRVFTVELKKERSPTSMSGDQYRAMLNEYELDHEGKIDFIHPAHGIQKIVTDLEMANVADPKQMVRYVVEEMLRRVLDPVVERSIKSLEKPVSPMAMLNSVKNVGGTVDSLYPLVSRNPCKEISVSPSLQPRCGECGGSGQVELFNTTVPCSRCTTGGTRPIAMEVRSQTKTERFRSAYCNDWLSVEAVAKSLAVTHSTGRGAPPVAYYNGEQFLGEERVAEALSMQATAAASNARRGAAHRAVNYAIQAGAAQANMKHYTEEDLERMTKELAEVNISFVQAPREEGFIRDKVFPKLKMAKQTNQYTTHGEPCPECDDTGEIQLFTSVEPCGKCRN
jgi:hypothetical protein